MANITEYIKTNKVGDTTIMVHYSVDDETWDVYYKRPGYPFLYAFGLAYWRADCTDDMFEIAEANIPQYEHLFE